MRLASDPVSAFGGIIALNQTIDAAAAEEMTKIFTEVVIAPDATDEAKAIFRGEEKFAAAADRRLSGFARRWPALSSPWQAAFSSNRATQAMPMIST